MSETADKKNIQKLQRAIVDGLEDVKAQEIQVFNTEGLSPLFERVIIASGNTNRQTRALAASVRDAVREAGFDKPRIEGEENGEWIIVDCGQAVVHVMQPTIRQYYRLEELWGDVPVRLRSSEAKAKAARAAAEKSNVASARKAAGTKAKPEGEALSPAEATKLAKRAAASQSADGDAPRKAPARKATAKTVRTAGGSAAPAAKKAPARKAAAKKLQVVKVGAPVKKPAAKRAAPKKA